MSNSGKNVLLNLPDMTHVGGINKGRPNAQDLKRAEEFAQSLKRAPGEVHSRQE
jgi:hypothetical protein